MIKKEVGRDYSDTNCAKCGSTSVTHTSNFIGWGFFIECKDCGTKHDYSVNDAMGCEGCSPYHFYSVSDTWSEDYFIQQLAKKLSNCEEGWENKNGVVYGKADRILHTSKNLLKLGIIND